MNTTRAKLVQIISGLFLCLVFFGGWGFLAGAYRIFPASILMPFTDEVVDFAVGGEGEQTTLADKIQHDFFGAQTRLAGHAEIDKLHKLELSPVSDPNHLLKGSATNIYYSATAEASGYYFFTTTVQLEDSVFSGVLVSADGELVRLYKVPNPTYELDGWPDHNHGGMTEEGYVAMNPYKRLFVRDFCGREVFERKEPGWHHDISGGDGVIWAWLLDNAVKLDAKTGQELKRFSILELIGANGDTSIFEPTLLKSPVKGSFGQWKYADILDGKIERMDQISGYDPFHQNDVDVLTEARAGLFPMFAAGDLLLSFRSTNLVVVVDPETLKVKWHSFGQFSRQHDPDWSPTGEITLFDNQSHNFNSRVVSLDPYSAKSRVILDGSKHGLYRFAKGSHQVDPDGGVIVDNMAEMAHFSPDGSVKFYIKVVSDGRDMSTGTVFHISQSEFDKLNESCD